MVALDARLADGVDQHGEQHDARPTQSMSADRRSATSVMPSGAGQPPAWTTAMPSSSTLHEHGDRQPTSTVESVVRPMTRCAVRGPPDEDRDGRGEQRQHDREQRGGRSQWVPERSVVRGLVVDDLDVGEAVAPDGAVLDVVGTSSSSVSSQLR